MAQWIRELIDSPQLARIAKNVSIGLVCLIVLGFLGYAGWRMLNTNDAMIQSVQTQNEINATTLQRQTDILSKQTDQLQDIKRHSDITSRALERIADMNERDLRIDAKQPAISSKE